MLLGTHASRPGGPSQPQASSGATAWSNTKTQPKNPTPKSTEKGQYVVESSLWSAVWAVCQRPSSPWKATHLQLAPQYALGQWGSRGGRTSSLLAVWTRRQPFRRRFVQAFAKQWQSHLACVARQQDFCVLGGVLARKPALRLYHSLIGRSGPHKASVCLPQHPLQHSPAVTVMPPWGVLLCACTGGGTAAEAAPAACH